MKWIGISLDGTLAHFDKTKPNNIGDPIKPMIDFVNEIIDTGDFEIRIVTSRASASYSLGIARSWLNQQGLYGIKITNEIDHDMHAIFDNKAMRVELNKGKVCSCCLSSAEDPKNNHSGMMSRANIFSLSNPERFETDC